MLDKIDEILKEKREDMENEGWVIENDDDADWWIETKKHQINEIKTYQDKLIEKINYYKEKLNAAKKEEQYAVEQMNEKLMEYFETIDPKKMKKTKTMLKYRLPNGELVKKYQNPQFKRDNNKLADWLEKNNMTDYLQIKKSAKWGELKKITQVNNGQVVTEDGEIVEGVEVVERPPKFEVEVD